MEADQPTSTRRVLLLDDSFITRQVLDLALQENGYTCATAANLEQFEELFKQFQPEIVLTDVNMPDIQGDQICRALKERMDSKNIPIILISSLADDELRDLSDRVGADGYLSKKESTDTMLTNLEEILSQIVF